MKLTKLIGLLLLVAVLVPTVAACHPEPEVIPEVEPVKVKLTTTIRHSHLTYIWNGKSWIPNPNYTVEVIEGRTYITYL